ncbi:M50 family metallopeptidase [Candidatus Synechococcus spongiarum]|uniref:M50 family metallopeptidase n=1 Tax=Candidatus Synechococcus spongiarum TaxID=431041 RepID=UPI0004B0C253|nr:site-2 protease family protein [Candidatus Synechococcus spongiarum]
MIHILAALAVLGLLIAIHEAGHFLAATGQGIRVSSFSIGLGPRLVGWRRRGVEFALRAIPIGGYVAFPDPESEEGIRPQDPDLFQNRPLPQRALVIAAGVLANLIFAWVALLAQGAVYGVPDGVAAAAGIVVTGVSPGSPAAVAALQPGDHVVAVNGQPLGEGNEAVKNLITAVQTRPGSPLTLQLEGGAGLEERQVTPRLDEEGTGRIGAQLQPYGTGRYRPVENVGEWLTTASRGFWTITANTLAGYGQLLTHFQATARQLGGPVRIVEVGAQLAQQGGASLLLFTALISINLAVLNALPLPALDGGQMLLLLWEGLRGQPLPERWTQAVNRLGFALLLGLVGVLMVRDTSQLGIFKAWLSS